MAAVAVGRTASAACVGAAYYECVQYDETIRGASKAEITTQAENQEECRVPFSCSVPWRRGAQGRGGEGSRAQIKGSSCPLSSVDDVSASTFVLPHSQAAHTASRTARSKDGHKLYRSRFDLNCSCYALCKICSANSRKEDEIHSAQLRLACKGGERYTQSSELPCSRRRWLARREDMRVRKLRRSTASRTPGAHPEATRRPAGRTGRPLWRRRHAPFLAPLVRPRCAPLRAVQSSSVCLPDPPVTPLFCLSLVLPSFCLCQAPSS